MNILIATNGSVDHFELPNSKIQSNRNRHLPISQGELFQRKDRTKCNERTSSFLQVVKILRITPLALFASILLSNCSKKSTNSSGPTGSAPSLKITGISPTSGGDSTLVTISGAGFSSTINDDIVTFNGKFATVTSANSTQLIAMVPLLAGTGAVSVSVNNTNFQGPVFTYDTSYVATPFVVNLIHPAYLAIDHNNNIYLTSDGTQDIRKISPSGTDSIILAGFTDPQGICLDAAGNLYFTNDSNNISYLYKVNTAGMVSLYGIDSNASIGGICIDGSGNIYGANELTGTLDVISSTGTATVLASGMPGASGVALAPDGSIYVIYTPNLYISTDGKIVKVSQSGVVTPVYSGLAFNDENAICVDKNGNLYVTCGGQTNQNNSVVEVNTEGVATTLSTSADFPCGIVIDSLGNIFFVNQENPFGTPSVYGDISMLAAK